MSRTTSTEFKRVDLNDGGEGESCRGAFGEPWPAAATSCGWPSVAAGGRGTAAAAWAWHKHPGSVVAPAAQNDQSCNGQSKARPPRGGLVRRRGHRGVAVTTRWGQGQRHGDGSAAVAACPDEVGEGCAWRCGRRGARRCSPGRYSSGDGEVRHRGGVVLCSVETGGAGGEARGVGDVVEGAWPWSR